MVCCIALVLILLQCLFGSSGYTFKVGAPEFVQLDLFDSLQLHNSTYEGVALGTGFHTNSPGVIFKGDFREIMVSSEWVDRVRGKLVDIGVNAFTVSAYVKQTTDNVGTLLAFSRGQVSALEIQSSGRKNELRVISNSRVETFPFRLADGSWHRLAVSFSASQVDILVNCSLIYRRVLSFDPATALFDSRNISIWIGQRTTSNFLYQGVMQDLRLTIGPYGYLSQCPQMDTQCPTCSDYTALKMSFASLQSQIQLLTDRLNRAEARLNVVEQCECSKPCRVNDTSVFNDGTTWNENCDICTCKKGEIECHPTECPKLNCTAPFLHPGKCCPTCLEQCWFRGKWYDHGEAVSMQECVDCLCKDGSMKCKKSDPCATLSCPPSEQLIVPGECCKVCPGTDYCAKSGSKCHRNATCVNLQTTYTCQCNDGFSGDGTKNCEDVDECLSERNHCARNTVCVNILGGYECPCLAGFKQVNQFQCEDEDECATQESNNCHLHATCYNTKGSYVCSCNPGYSGDGTHCSPVCNQTCANGGVCTAPGICSCRSGWTGPQCETDIDECLLPKGMQNSSTSVKVAGPLCPDNANCVNKPGWYLCQCRDGFQASLAQDRQASCQDIDECERKPCADGLQCFNTIGSFECHCVTTDNNQCPTPTDCVEGGKHHETNSKWFNGDCSRICTCSSPGSTSCHPSSEEECSLICPTQGNNAIEGPNSCCDKCRGVVVAESTSNKKTCRHQKYKDTTYQSGEIWHFQCQTCECQNGEIDCWPSDCPPLKCHNPILPPGDCCHRCPEEEKCTHNSHNSSFAECHLLENTIESGAQLTLPHHHCLSCKCQDGELCCSYDYNCVAHTSDDPLLTP